MAPISVATSPCSARRAIRTSKGSAFSGSFTSAPHGAAPLRAARGQVVAVRAERGGGGFVSGFVLGGVVCGVLGFIFAPQISRALLGEDQRIRLPRFMEEADLDPEVTKQNLAEKIAQLNAAIDDVSAQLRSQESEETTTSA